MTTSQRDRTVLVDSGGPATAVAVGWTAAGLCLPDRTTAARRDRAVRGARRAS